MNAKQTFWLIIVGVIAWGLYLAVGTSRGGVDPVGGGFLKPDVRRGLMVMACVVGFLGFWAAMLAARKRRLNRNETADARRGS